MVVDWEEMEGVLRLDFRVEGLTRGDSGAELRDALKEGEERSGEWERDVVEAVGDLEISPGVGLLSDVDGCDWLLGERGRGVSSREKMERSSPFQRSPHW